MTKRARIKVKPVGVKTSASTRREAQAQFHRNKQQQHRRQMRRRAALIAVGVASIAMGVFSWQVQRSGAAQRWADGVREHAWRITADAGFAVNQVYLEGREHADAAVVKAAVSVQPGMPILQLPLKEIQARLEAIPEVKSARISRQLPGDVRIVLTERTPAALWQSGDGHVLVDSDGVVLAKGNYPNIRRLPVIVGQDAPKHVRELTALLASVPELQQEVVAAVRIGDRRWNLQLKRNITVMLPETAPETAWKRFAKLVASNGLFSKAIRSVDMRMEDRVFILPLEQQKSMITLTNAQET